MICTVLFFFWKDGGIMIKAEDITFNYIRRDTEQNVVEIKLALDKVNIHIKKGEFVAILGHNGSGKSTFAKHVNAIFSPEEGSMYVDGMDTSDLSKLYDIRQKAGMVFQNPDNQIIATVVEEDVAFGLENIGVPTKSIRQRVESALKSVSMWKHRKSSPNKLSGGQKQRVAIAGIMAMEPDCIVLDEPTAMLDPKGRKEVMDTVKRLNREKNITILLITHNMDEAVDADRIVVMDHGQVKLCGNPKEVFCHVDELKEYGLEVPFATRIGYSLRKAGLPLPLGIIKENELIYSICDMADEMRVDKRALRRKENDIEYMAEPKAYKPPAPKELVGKSSLILDHVSYIYNSGNVYEKTALKDVNLTFTKGEFVGVVGHTGSGKSTLIQHLNGLLKPTEGTVYYCGEDIASKEFSLRTLRSKVGMSFQYPEHQLFENTIYDDVAFGPRQLGWDELKIEKNTFEAIRLVGLQDNCYDLSPFQLSGGQKRRVALAGVLAMEPDYLVLDEPAAGLDPRGRDEILNRIYSICKEKGIAVILVSHSMEDVARYADRIIVIDDGEIVYNDTAARVFVNADALEKMGLSAPKVTYMMRSLSEYGFPEYPYIIKEEEAVSIIKGWFAG